MSKVRFSRQPLSSLLKVKKFPSEEPDSTQEALRELQMQMLRIQQGVWHSKKRAIVVFEGFDAAGKGGAIRRLTEVLDPRGVRVHPVGPPTPEEREKHYLYRFWRDLPEAGAIAIFDRSWYGRVLVERVEKLVPKERWQEAYGEINEFESQLVADGIDLVKIFLAIHPQEQLKRFEDRLRDPYKQWKITDADIEARSRWDKYVKATDEMLVRTNTKAAPWNLIPADSKDYARRQTLKIVTRSLRRHGDWIESVAQRNERLKLKESLKKLKALS